MMKLPKFPPLYVAAAVLAVLLLIWLGSKCTTDPGKYEKARAVWEAERKALHTQIDAGKLENAELLSRVRDDSIHAAPMIAEADSLQTVVNRERAAKIAALNQLAARHRELRDTTELSRIAGAAIAAAQAARQEADTLSRTVTSLRGVIDRQTVNLAAVSGALRTAELRADSAIALLDRAPVYKSDKLLGFIPLPSRSASFIIGGAVGAAAVILAVK